MYKPQLSPIFLPIYLYMELTSYTEWVTMVKLDINSVEVHPQLSHKGRPSSGWGCAGRCWFTSGPELWFFQKAPKSQDPFREGHICHVQKVLFTHKTVLLYGKSLQNSPQRDQIFQGYQIWSIMFKKKLNLKIRPFFQVV